MVKDGELEPGQLAASQIYTNELNPFAADAAAETSTASSPR